MISKEGLSCRGEFRTVSSSLPLNLRDNVFTRLLKHGSGQSMLVKVLSSHVIFNSKHIALVTTFVFFIRKNCLNK